MHRSSLKRIILAAGDTVAFYGALVLSLVIRYRLGWFREFHAHLLPFTFVLGIGFLVFYAMRLYDVVAGQGPTRWLQSTLSALSLQFIGAVLFFYFFSRNPASIAPRGTLFLFFLIFSALLVPWRKFARAFLENKFRNSTLVIGEDSTTNVLTQWLREHPESGHEVRALLASSDTLSATEFSSLLQTKKISTIIANREHLESIAPYFINSTNLDVNFWDLAHFYETRLEKIPLAYMNDAWVLQNVIRKETPVSTLNKSFIDLAAAGTLFLVTSPLWPLIALTVRTSSPGPIFYEQTRVGQHGKIFKLKKFRTMYQDAEARGPQWSQKNDPRVTFMGKILRRTHLDELPQLLNILRGEMSFVGPRPERPEFVQELEQKIPYYRIRHFVKPGFTGWAQLNYAYGSSVEDAIEKLQYDLYYLKHRAFLLDASIVLKTIRLLFHTPEKVS